MATNLQFIKSETATSGTTTLNITDCFSANYDEYAINFNKFYASGIDYFYFRFIDSSGSVISTSNYTSAGFELKSNTTFVERHGTFDNLWQNQHFLPNSEAESYSGVLYIFNPFTTNDTYMLGQSTLFEYGHNYNGKYSSFFDLTTSFTGFQLSVGTLSQTFSGGEVSVYGVK